ncbi:MAG TPA: glutamine synthetase family protein [Steroidobacteraceae bacterium]|nr:glutamine synthetase family protein [Steroidobacteraceae bacterium]
MPTPVSDIESFTRAHPDTQFIDVLLPDLLSTPRGKRLKIDALASVYAGAFRLPGSIFAMDALGNTIEATGLGFDDGDADRSCIPVSDSLVTSPWMDEGVAQIQVSMADHDGQPFFGDPRHVLGGVVSRFTRIGLRPVIALEVEFYVVDTRRTRQGGIQPAATPGKSVRRSGKQINSMARIEEMSAILAEISRICEIQNVPATSMLAESGPGQYEVNLRHVDDPCLACDHVIRLKRIVRGVFLKHGLSATFMAKPYADEPGSGTHIHVSLLREDGTNLFASSGKEPNQALRHAIGGLAATMSESMLVFAPTANSFKRFRPECYVPLGPTWGLNNRGVALRIPADTPENQRVEHRVAGADVNPYLLAATVLAGIHRGIEQKIQPGKPVSGNPYRQGASAPADLLPTHWHEAALAFERSEFLQEYLGAGFQRLFVTTRRAELQSFDHQVTPLEYDWYLTAG